MPTDFFVRKALKLEDENLKRRSVDKNNETRSRKRNSCGRELRAPHTGTKRAVTIAIV